MRWDDFRRSDNIEDDRDAGYGGGYGGGGFGIPGGGARHRHRHRARPDRLGDRHRSEHSDRRRGAHQRRLAVSAGLSAEQPAHRRAERPHRPVRRRRARQYRGHLGRDIFKRGPAIPSAAAAALSRRRAGRLRLRASGDGAVLLPERPAHLSRHLVLQRHAGALPRLQRQGLRIRRSLCDRARGRPSRAEPARHSAEGAVGAARRRQQSGGQPHPGAGRIAGRLLRRRLGASFRPALELDRAGRRRGGAADGGGDRRRPAAEAVARLRRARRLHPRHFGAAPALVHHRPESRARCRPATPSRRLHCKDVPTCPASTKADNSCRSRSRC